MTNTDRIAQLQRNKATVHEQMKSGEVNPEQCKGMIKMIDYKIRKLTHKQPPAEVAKILPKEA